MKETKKIILFTSSYPYGNRETFLEAEIEQIAAEFNEILIFPNTITEKLRPVPKNVYVFDTWNKLIKSNYFKFSTIPFSFLFLKNLNLNIKHNIMLFKYLSVNKLMNEFMASLSKKDIDNSIFYTYWFASITVALCIWKSNNIPIKVITRAHGADLYEERIKKLNFFPLRYFALNQLDFVFPISIDGFNHLQEQYSFHKSNIIVQKLGTKTPLKSNSHIDNNILRVVSCSFLTSVKRINLLVEALAHFKDSTIKVEWVHFGGGPLSNNIKELAEKELVGFVNYKLMGDVSNQVINDYYQNESIDVFINVSESEGIPVSIMEAQSYSIPVIATNVGGVKEIVNNNNGALLSSNPDTKEIFKTLLDVKMNKSKWLDKREVSKKDWNEKYNAEKNYAQFAAKLNELL